MRCACIDIGSNTTRVLVADVEGGRLREVLQRKAYTRIGRELRREGHLSAPLLANVAAVVAEQRRLAERTGARAIRTVATHAVRAADNRADICAALRSDAGVTCDVLTEDEEARLAFHGATATFDEPLADPVAVVDVGGGSSEIAVGTLTGGVTWSQSFRIGSGLLSDLYLRADPPTTADLDAIAEHAAGVLAHTPVPASASAVAVGGSAASLRRVVGPELNPEALRKALAALVAAPSPDVAYELGLEAERVRLLPAGIIVLRELVTLVGRPLVIGCGGIREGVCLELSHSDDDHGGLAR